VWRKIFHPLRQVSGWDSSSNARWAWSPGKSADLIELVSDAGARFSHIAHHDEVRRANFYPRLYFLVFFVGERATGDKKSGE